MAKHGSARGTYIAGTTYSSGCYTQCRIGTLAEETSAERCSACRPDTLSAHRKILFSRCKHFQLRQANAQSFAAISWNTTGIAFDTVIDVAN